MSSSSPHSSTSTQSLRHSSGRRNLKASKVNKLLGASSEEIKAQSHRNLHQSDNSLLGGIVSRRAARRRSNSSNDIKKDMEELTSSITSTGSGTSLKGSGGRRNVERKASISGSIGGILKNTLFKKKSDEDGICDGSLTSSARRKSQETISSTARSVSFGDSNNAPQSTTTMGLIQHRNQSRPGRHLMERSMSRRARNSFRVGPGTGSGNSFYVRKGDPRATSGDIFNNAVGIDKCNNIVKHIRVNAILSSGKKLHSFNEDCDEKNMLSSIILKSLTKKNFCDAELVGLLDGVVVKVPSYLLAVHSEVFESMFYSSSNDNDNNVAAATANTNATAENVEDATSPKSETSLDDSLRIEDDEFFDSIADLSDHNKQYLSIASSSCKRVDIPFAKQNALKATMHFLATRSFPDEIEKIGANESSIRTICQIHLFGRIYKISSLQDHADRVARLLMNRVPSLICAAFDECIAGSKRLPLARRMSSTMYDGLMEYASEYLRDSPLTTLLDGGTIYLNDQSMEAIICDQDMDVDEHTMFAILNKWVKQDESNNIEVGKALVKNINLAYIKSDYLNNVVRKCGFVETTDIETALREIEEMLVNQSPDEKEHVLVEGAGNKEINGIYVRMDEDIGLGGEEIMFIKETGDDDDDGGYVADYGLYLLRSTWSITSCVDYSNILYSCDAADSAHLTRTPKEGWKTVNGNDPAPTCTWKPSKELGSSSGKGFVAPNLADRGRNHRNLSDVAKGDHSEGSLVRRLTLRTMINLPTDEDFEEDDYHASDGDLLG